MKRLVLDANVAAKWVLPAENELLVEQALILLERYETGAVQLIVPDLFWSEIANLLWKAVQQKRLASSSAYEALTALRERRLPSHSSVALLDYALELAIAYEHSAYDCIYVALAASSETELITADRRLATVFGSRLPVKWLGAFSIG